MDTVYRRLATNQPEWVKGLYCIYIKVDTAAAVFVNRSSSDVRHDLIKISPFFFILCLFCSVFHYSNMY